MKEYHEVQWRIFHTLGYLLEKSNLEHISIKQLCEASHVSRQTFYRYFSDKYAVVTWHFDFLAKDTLHEVGRTLTWLEAHIKLFTELYKERAIYAHVSDSEDYNAVRRYAYRHSIDIYTKTLIDYKKIQPTTTLLFQIDAAALIASELTFRWGQRGMEESPKELAILVDSVLPEELKDVFERGICFHKQADPLSL
ncbi:transcriptional regulator [Desulfitobacterium dichloroeliminans LMG P-21439]|uniref:Transcriptional regulator n=1 Tax=Desulfitobacterium dichloroeliminans (strain LMG P-21439 / DCA1) TaxID=871963 RepID=L0F909_DESDL|nr:TetR/AcrR family transcriptional regulator C-terminal domain-containing protein [Desulfitobacterium dichloroeliminans]AGA69131.1 transcriptional regulator [Desulfitobacterium dichloroeliminans LMG P-21439]